ncbi:hypothetical protein TREMEDRAFT_66633 [Tremella mesenterica DSM 1558]|uniref:uncharacterized protein n=1 Tax=Tremella mesenterica (strain ATCC 24925 / CBS 8224 / DSM 1558 / NBRC 9311 / NRRL Y-6157 / RJB 2259-6 / UBC 559-6) TaxID=578456 RepID=UPI0003F49603|nr:uncharacterized protein TREMEDRAFT_66633 [Tremella mesenterica DSM 1558]EIW71942.1 hypothetical protein TREMEDRAFT_66633 [Tremella mesenterica DSM 1558]
MFDLDTVIQTAFRECSDLPSGNYLLRIPPLSPRATPLSVVSFNCLLQDTGYPLEVFLPGGVTQSTEVDLDPTLLKERWIGWGVQIPGQQPWSSAKSALEHLSGPEVTEAHLMPKTTRSKFPLPTSRDSYVGALLKIYDGQPSHKPGSVEEYVGIVCQSPLPTAMSSDGDEDIDMVPCLHVLSTRSPNVSAPPFPSDDTTRTELIRSLGECFQPRDDVAGELLLLFFLSYPVSRPSTASPIGTLALNLLRSKSSSGIEMVTRLLMPIVVELPLTLPLLHSETLYPRCLDSTNLEAGLLQLAPGTVLVLDEDGMGEGGQLGDKAVKNLQALAQCISEQTLRYEYPYMENLKMECAIRPLIFSQGRSLLPVDICLPVTPSDAVPDIDEPTLQRYRSFLAGHATSSRAAQVEIPDAISAYIQEGYVVDRRTNAERGEATSRARADMIRLLALSHEPPILSRDVWERAIALDTQVLARLRQRNEAREIVKPGALTTVAT